MVAAAVGFRCAQRFPASVHPARRAPGTTAAFTQREHGRLSGNLPIVTITPEECLQRVRALCLALPEVTERVSHGEPSWFVRKQFLTMADHHHDDRFGFWAAAPDGAQQRWLSTNEGLGEPRYFYPPYVGGRGWIGVYLDVSQNWHDVTEIVDDAWTFVAPAKLRAAR